MSDNEKQAEPCESCGESHGGNVGDPKFSTRVRIAKLFPGFDPGLNKIHDDARFYDKDGDFTQPSIGLAMHKRLGDFASLEHLFQALEKLPEEKRREMLDQRVNIPMSLRALLTTLWMAEMCWEEFHILSAVLGPRVVWMLVNAGLSNSKQMDIRTIAGSHAASEESKTLDLSRIMEPGEA